MTEHVQCSSSLKVKEFTYLQILDNDANDVEVLRFAGVSDENMEQELILHREGDPYQINGQAIHEYEGDFVVKWPDGSLALVRKQTLELLIEKIE